jgi:hypothetical protein
MKRADRDAVAVLVWSDADHTTGEFYRLAKPGDAAPQIVPFGQVRFPYPDLLEYGLDAILTRERHIEYVARFGGMCKDCDYAHGRCFVNGLPCETDEKRKAIRHVLTAVMYGLKHGFIQ